MTTTKWDGGVIPSTAVNADNTTLVQAFAAANLQAVFNLTNFAYALGTNSLRVSVNGAVQRVGVDFLETTPASFTFTSPLEVDDIVYAEGLVGSIATQSAEASAAAAALSAILAGNYLAAIQALTPPSLPLSIANGGTGATNKTIAFRDLSPQDTKGDLIIHDGANPVKLGVGVNYSILVPDSTAPLGQIYRGNKPVLREVRNAVAPITAADGGKEIVITTPPAGFVQTIDLAANLYPGWTVWIKNGDTPASAGKLTLKLSGTDIYADYVVANTFDIPIGGIVQLQCDGAGVFSFLSRTNARNYFKVRDQKAAGVSNAAAVLGLNDRNFNTVVENTFGDNPLVIAPFIAISSGVWSFSIRTVHTGTAATRLGLYNQVGGTLYQASLSNPPNSLTNVHTGRILVTSAVLLFQVREWFSAAGGTLGAAINDGNPEIYAEAEFWKD